MCGFCAKIFLTDWCSFSSTFVSFVPHINHCAVCTPYQPLCRLHSMSTIVSFVPHINHCVVCTSYQPLCTPYQPLCRLCPISTIVPFVPHISHCVVCTPYQPFCRLHPISNHYVLCTPYQPLCRWHPISAFVYPISTIVSFVPLSAIVHNYGSLKYLGHEIREKNYLDFHTSKSIIVVQLCVIKTPRA